MCEILKIKPNATFIQSESSEYFHDIRHYLENHTLDFIISAVKIENKS